MATYSATGITLLVHKYRGTQRLAVFYTRERGKLEAVASGVGKPGSKLAPAVEPLTLSKLFLADGRSFDRLTQCDVIDSFYALRKDLGRLALASYVAELVAQTTEPGDPDPPLFDGLRLTLDVLSATSQPELATWGFALRYLHARGVGPVIEGCVECGERLQGNSTYVVALGGCACLTCGVGETGRLRVSPQSRGAMQSLLRMPPDRLDRVKLDPGGQREIRDLVRRHIRYHMGLSLKSGTFLDKMGWTTKREGE